MATRVCIWNVEKLGQNFRTDATSAALRCNLLAALIHDMGAQVVLIQELHKEGVPWVAAIRTALAQIDPNAGWHFDCVKGGVSSGATPAGTTFANTTFEVTCKEGYAVLWRDNVLQTLGQNRSIGVDRTETSTRSGNSYLDICLAGNQIQLLQQYDEPRMRQVTPATPLAGLSGYPVPDCQSANEQRSINRQQVWQAGDGVQQRYGSRRPAWVTVRSGNTNYNVVAYHAPNTSLPTMYGPLLALSAILPNGGAKVIGGDWNTIETPRRKAIAVAATNQPFGLTSPILKTDGTVNGSASMVHPDKYGAWSTGNGVLTSHRDFAVLNIQNVTPAVTLPAIYFAGALGANNPVTLQRLMASRLTILQQTTGNYPVWPNTTYGTVSINAILAAYFQGCQTYNGQSNTDTVSIATNGKADFATAFALLYRRFVTDHLPILFDLP